SLKTSIKTITYLSDTGCLEIQGASLEHTVAITTSFDIFIQLLLIQVLTQGELRHSRTTKKRDYSFLIFKN
ncbi:hypothetical protein PO631_14985, partial [Escherichia coli]